MKTIFCLAPAFLSVNLIAAETAISPKIESVSLFKNGLCVVRASFEAKEPGTFVWSDPPRCVHGTFMVDSTADVALSSGMRTIEEAITDDRPTGSLQNDLAGQKVKVRLRGNQSTPPQEIVGRVWALPPTPPTPHVWDGSLTEDPNYYNRMAVTPPPAPSTTGNYLVIETEQNRLYLESSQIASVEVEGAKPDRKRNVEKPVMVFEAAKAGSVNISYLTRGASWVPSYHVDLSDPKNLRVRQTALIRNELTPWKKVQLQLISGYPNVQFGHVDSPLWPKTTLATFFGQLRKDARMDGGAASQQVMYNSGRLSGRMGEVQIPDMPIEGGQSEDMHFESIGARDLNPGDSLSVEVAQGTASYERVVEWTAADNRTTYGQYERSGRETNDDQPWDAVLFQNPLKFPMTTAAATVTEKNQFRGQSLSPWTNPGQRACLKITKALSVQADRQEQEEQDNRANREYVTVGAHRYYRVSVKGTLTMHNYRSQPAVMLTRAQFSGNLVSADENPGDTIRAEGVFNVNARHELEWKLTLAPGAEKKLNYRYSVLVRE